MPVQKYAPTRYRIVANVHGEEIDFGISARHTRRALLTAASANGPLLMGKMTEAELNSDWSYKNDTLTLAPGVTLRFAETERQANR